MSWSWLSCFFTTFLSEFHPLHYGISPFNYSHPWRQSPNTLQPYLGDHQSRRPYWLHGQSAAIWQVLHGQSAGPVCSTHTQTQRTVTHSDIKYQLLHNSPYLIHDSRTPYMSFSLIFFNSRFIVYSYLTAHAWPRQLNIAVTLCTAAHKVIHRNNGGDSGTFTSTTSAKLRIPDHRLE